MIPPHMISPLMAAPGMGIGHYSDKFARNNLEQHSCHVTNYQIDTPYVEKKFAFDCLVPPEPVFREPKPLPVFAIENEAYNFIMKTTKTKSLDLGLGL